MSSSDGASWFWYMKRRTLRTLAASAILLFTFAPLARGEGYGGTDDGKPKAETEDKRPHIDKENEEVKVDDKRKVRIKASGYKPLSIVKVTIFSDPIELGSVTADGNGDIDVTVQIPASLPEGDHNIVSSGIDINGIPYATNSPVNVASPRVLAFTGSNSGNLAVVAGILVVVGAAGTASARKRMQSSVTQTNSVE
jgi:hypothetical protein